VSADPEAYATYLKGRAFLSRRTVDNLRRAIECFERAIELDPGHAAAHAALATAYGILPNYAASVPADVWAKAKASALKALAIDGGLPEAHAALGMILQSEWDWEGTEKEIRKAIELSPSYALAYHWLGMIVFGFGRFDEAIAALKKSQTLDPLSAVQHGALGQVYACAGRPDLALAEFNMDFALGEDNRILRVFRGEIYLSQGRYELARMDFEKARELAGGFDPNVELVLASLGEAMGEKGAVEASLGRVLEQAKREPISPYLLALFYFTLGRNDEGFALLERAFAERDYELTMMAVDPRLASCRSDPRYTSLLKRIGLAR
jgi:tetratricopeptide (TPR) repeat protein